MRFICFMCPTIIILFIVRNKNTENEFLHQLKLYLVSLPIVNAIASFVYYSFSSHSQSVWNRVEGEMMVCTKYVVISFAIAILLGLLLECARLNLTLKVTTRDKQEKNNEKESEE